MTNEFSRQKSVALLCSGFERVHRKVLQGRCADTVGGVGFLYGVFLSAHAADNPLDHSPILQGGGGSWSDIPGGTVAACARFGGLRLAEWLGKPKRTPRRLSESHAAKRPERGLNEQLETDQSADRIARGVLLRLSADQAA